MRPEEEVGWKPNCSEYLSGSQIDAVLARRDKTLEVYRQVVAGKGPSVIYP